MENNTKKEKINYYKQNLKYLLSNGFYLVSIESDTDVFGIVADFYNFEYCDNIGNGKVLSIPAKNLFSTDLTKAEKFNEKMKGFKTYEI